MTILDQGRVVGIVRYREAGRLHDAIRVLADAGIPLIEVTLDTPDALGAIGAAAGEGIVVGAGTVRSAEDVRAAADAGARFVVSPGLTDEVVEGALGLGIEPIPGVLTPTELQRAQDRGAEAVKLFPVGPVGGPGFVSALRGPFPAIGLLPTGGIAIADIAGYLDAGADAVGIGGALVGRRPPTTDGELEALRSRAAATVREAAR